MNKNAINKLKFFLGGIESRIADNIDLMKKLEVTYKSGLKNYKGNGTFIDDKVQFNFKGVTNTISINETLNLILSEATNYDSLIITIEERGSLVEITADDKDVKVKNKELEIKEESHEDIGTSTLLNRKYLINHVKAAPLLKELGILTKDGKIKNDKIRKYNQIDHYIELLEKDLGKFNESRIHIVDCGCGKSYLSFALNYYLTEVKKIKCQFTGIDISKEVIETSKKMAQNLGYKNMNFIANDIKNLKLDIKPTVVISLHACDNATDMALSFGVKNDADLIIAVPCCHAEMNSKYEYKEFSSIIKHGILKRRMADVLTDGVRALILESKGYDVSIFEYISPLETPKNLMIKALKTNKYNRKSEDELMNLILKLNYAPALYRYLNDLD